MTRNAGISTVAISLPTATWCATGTIQTSVNRSQWVERLDALNAIGEPIGRHRHWRPPGVADPILVSVDTGVDEEEPE